MVFNSIEFLIFLPCVFILYWLFPKKFKWLVLLMSSYFFYMYWNWKLIFLILFTTIISYVGGLLIEKYKDKPKIKKSFLLIVCLLCFGVLIFFKYFNFLYDIYKDIVHIFTGNFIHGYFDILLPVGISFYTFQTASYVIDIYNGKMKAEKHFGYYALFVSFFPQLVAGPIERPADLLPQLKNREVKIKEVDYSGAFRYMLIGFFKKIAIADIIGIYVNIVYNDINNANGLMILIGTVLFSFQILCDFSGYSDIAIGCAKLFGVNLTENFNEPYRSKSIKEFWNRWHISLSRWLRDYIYFPLGGSRVSKIRWIINILIVFLVSGIWHGASYNFIIWGLLHGCLQIIGVLTLKYRDNFWKKLKIDSNGECISGLRIIVTFGLVSFTWIFFRANTINDAFTAVGKLFTDYRFDKDFIKSTFTNLNFSFSVMVYIIFILLILQIINGLKNIENNGIKILNNSIIRFTTYLILLWFVFGAWVYLQASEIGSSFIYFQF